MLILLLINCFSIFAIKDYYKILGISENVSDNALWETYAEERTKIGDYQNPAHRYQELTEAIEIVGNPEKRKKYDKELKNYRQSVQELEDSFENITPTESTEDDLESGLEEIPGEEYEGFELVPNSKN